MRLTDPRSRMPTWVVGEIKLEELEWMVARIRVGKPGVHASSSARTASSLRTAIPTNSSTSPTRPRRERSRSWSSPRISAPDSSSPTEYTEERPGQDGRRPRRCWTPRRPTTGRPTTRRGWSSSSSQKNEAMATARKLETLLLVLESSSPCSDVVLGWLWGRSSSSASSR